MKIFKKIVSAALAASMLIVPCPVPAEEAAGFSENFSAMTVGEAPTGFDAFSGGGSITVREREANKYVAVSNENEGVYVTLQRTFGEIMGVVTAKADFRQNYVKSDGNVIIQLLYDSTVICSVETAGGDIVYRGSSENTVIVDNYAADTCYSIHLEVDLDKGTVQIYADGSLVTDSAATLSESSKVNTFKAYAFMAPGFELDNLYVAASEEITAATLSGADTQSIPHEGTQVYEYTAAATTASGLEIAAASFDFTIEPADVTGVTLTPLDGKTAQITISNEAAAGTTYKLVTALSSDDSVRAEKTLTIQEAAFEKIEISGEGSIALYLANAGDTYPYSAKVIDEFGNEMAGESVVWSASGEGMQYLSLEPGGVLKVTAAGDIDSQLEIKATLASDETKFTTRTIRLTDIRTHLSDETRRAVLKEYMDTVLEYGKDIYTGSPRIADGVNRDGEAIKWRTLSGDEVPLADMGNEWELLRTMIAYSDTGGDPYYKERAYELYRWTMEHDISENNLVYWGSHKAIDLRTGKPTGNKDTGIGEYHEVEEKDMYFTPFYETDEEKTADMVRAIWMGHVTDWSNLMFNRHAQHTKSTDRTTMWDNVDQYDEDYWKEDAFIRDYDGCTFFLAASEYISAAVELYNRTGEEAALTWARRMAERFANLADKKTGIMPSLYATPYGDPRITDENGNISLNIRPAFVDQMATAPRAYQSSSYGDRVYVQFAKDMEEKGLLDGIDVSEHMEIPTDETLSRLIREDGAKALILEMYYNRNWPWVYGKSMFSVLELIEAMGLEDENDEGFPLFAEWMHGYKSYIDLAYEGNSQIGVTFACGIKLDNYVTAVPGYTSNRGSMLDSTIIDLETIVPAIEAIYMLDRFDRSVEVFNDGETVVTVGDVLDTVWNFVNSMSDYYDIGYMGQPTEGIMPEFNFHTSCDDANALNAIIEIYRNTGIREYLDIARIIANNIIENQYSGGLFAPDDQYGTWVSSHAAAVIMKLDAVINGTWSDALDFSFASYIYHQAEYINEHGKVPSIQHDPRYEEEYTEVLAKKIKVDKTDIKMQVGDIEHLTVTVLPDDADSKSYYWEVSDQSVVKVGDNNEIYAVGRGNAVIRAVINDTAVESEDIHIVVE